MSLQRPTGPRDVVRVDLPSINPFAIQEDRPASRNQGGSTGRRGGPARTDRYAREEEQEEEKAVSDGGIVILSSENPFAETAPKPSRSRTGAQASHRSSGRHTTRHEDSEEEDAGEMIVLPSVNPFAQDGDDDGEEDRRRGPSSKQPPHRSLRHSAAVQSDVASEEEVPRPRKSVAAKPKPRISVRSPSPPPTRSPATRPPASPSKKHAAVSNPRPRTNSRSHIDDDAQSARGSRDRGSDRADSRKSQPNMRGARLSSPVRDDRLLVTWTEDEPSDESFIDDGDRNGRRRGAARSKPERRNLGYSSDVTSETYSEQTYSDQESVEEPQPPMTSRPNARLGVNPAQSFAKSPAAAPHRAPSVDGARSRTSGHGDRHNYPPHDEPVRNREKKHQELIRKLPERRNVDLQFPSTSEDMSDIVSSDEETVSYSRSTAPTSQRSVHSSLRPPLSSVSSHKRSPAPSYRSSHADEPKIRPRGYEDKSSYEKHSDLEHRRIEPQPRPRWSEAVYDRRDRYAPDQWSNYEDPPVRRDPYEPPSYRRDAYHHDSYRPPLHPSERWNSRQYPSPPPPPREWVEDHAPRRPYGTYGPYLSSFGRPLFDHIPEARSLLDQCRAPYPALAVPPDELLRELRAEREAKPLFDPGVPPRPTPKDLLSFDNAYALLRSKDTMGFLSALSYQELKPHYTDQVLQTLTNVVQVRFGERQGEKIVNRVHVVPRGRLAYGTIMAARPKIDVDLVIPSDFVLRRWSVNPNNVAGLPNTAAKALGLTPVSIARGEVDADKLDWVLQAVWEQMDGFADGLIFPGGAAEALNYLPEKWCVRHKADVVGTNRLRLLTNEENPIMVNLFVKVAMSVNGQEMVVGVDQTSARSAGKYQIVKALRGPGISLSEAPLSPTDRSAIIALNWWQLSQRANTTKQDATDLGTPHIRTNHFLLALSALHDLTPTDPLHVPRAKKASLPFSLVRVLDVMSKILTYLERACTPAPTMTAVEGANGAAMQYMFPLSSCTIMDALYTQAHAKPAEHQRLIESTVISDMQNKIQEALDALKLTGAEPHLFTRETS